MFLKQLADLQEGEDAASLYNLRAKFSGVKSFFISI